MTKQNSTKSLKTQQKEEVTRIINEQNFVLIAYALFTILQFSILLMILL